MSDPVVVTPKPWYRSVTVWTNVGAFIAAAIPLVTAYIGFLDSIEFVSERTSLVIATTLGLANAVLQMAIRIFATSVPIEGPVANSLPNVLPPQD